MNFHTSQSDRIAVLSIYSTNKTSQLLSSLNSFRLPQFFSLLGLKKQNSGEPKPCRRTSQANPCQGPREMAATSRSRDMNNLAIDLRDLKIAAQSETYPASCQVSLMLRQGVTLTASEPHPSTFSKDGCYIGPYFWESVVEPNEQGKTASSRTCSQNATSESRISPLECDGTCVIRQSGSEFTCNGPCRCRT